MKRTFGLPVLPILSLALVLCCSIVGLAQNREKFVISAKAGGINAITGGASVHGKGETDWQQLSITDDLEAGDSVRTSNDGRVEILLNPGSYLRVGGNSEVELSDNTLSNLEVRLLRGTAIVEATGADGVELNISISTPHTKLAIVRQGLYRLNVVPEDATELIVRKGRVILSDSHTKVKGGNKVIFSATTISVAKLTKEEKKAADKSDVDVWSKQRADTLAKANRRITDRMLTSAFASYGGFDPWRRNGLGFWFFNSRIGCFTFLPFYYGWGSPYGSTYSTFFYPYPYGTIWNNGTTGYWPNNTGSSGNRGGTGGQGNTSGGGTSGGGGTYRPPTPPPTTTPSMDPSGGMGRTPRIINPETGNPMPRKNIEPSRPNN
ncbi:MAG TPA: FecR family protein [Pyrinomonadaceae bacterium]|nr:FecR family protein [Pyrinomonadaceae bacterium]